MIKMVRLDERLIHGQVAIKWSRHIGVDRIVVANNEAAASPIIQKSLLMAAPATVKVAIKSISESIALVNDPRAADLKILLIVATPQDLLDVVGQVSSIPLINVGNYGRIASKQGNENRKSYGSNLYLYEAELEILQKVLSFNIETIYQTTPEDVPEALKKVIQL